MKKPELKVIRFYDEDIIATSGRPRGTPKNILNVIPISDFPQKYSALLGELHEAMNVSDTENTEYIQIGTINGNVFQTAGSAHFSSFRADPYAWFDSDSGGWYTEGLLIGSYDDMNFPTRNSQ